MVKLKVASRTGDNSKDPDIFHAAATDDPIELAEAIEAGQSLNSTSQQIGLGLTPIHLACVQKNLNFLNAALELDFDPWIRDHNKRLSVDHARAMGLIDVQKRLITKLYPKYARDSQVLGFPSPEA